MVEDSVEDNMRQTVIYGAGGCAREVAWLISVVDPERQAVAYIDDDPRRHGSHLGDLPIMSLTDARCAFPDAGIVGAVGSPQLRKSMVDRAAAEGFSFDTLVHPGVLRSSRVHIGEGSVVCAGTVLTTDISLGNHVQINVGCTVGHDVEMGDYATLAPGVHVAGRVLLEPLTYIGIGAAIRNGVEGAPIVIGAGATVGAGACVTKSVPPGTTVVGVPARPRIPGAGT